MAFATDVAQPHNFALRQADHAFRLLNGMPAAPPVHGRMEHLETQDDQEQHDWYAATLEKFADYHGDQWQDKFSAIHTAAMDSIHLGQITVYNGIVNGSEDEIAQGRHLMVSGQLFMDHALRNHDVVDSVPEYLNYQANRDPEPQDDPYLNARYRADYAVSAAATYRAYYQVEPEAAAEYIAQAITSRDACHYARQFTRENSHADVTTGRFHADLHYVNSVLFQSDESPLLAEAKRSLYETAKEPALYYSTVADAVADYAVLHQVHSELVHLAEALREPMDPGIRDAVQHADAVVRQLQDQVDFTSSDPILEQTLASFRMQQSAAADTPTDYIRNELIAAANDDLERVQEEITHYLSIDADQQPDEAQAQLQYIHETIHAIAMTNHLVQPGRLEGITVPEQQHVA